MGGGAVKRLTKGACFFGWITSEYYSLSEFRRRFGPGDLLYVPHYTVHRQFNADPQSPLMLLSGQSRLFKLVGYNAVVYLEDAPGHTGRPQAAGKARE